jgi:hypothetical protein
MTAEPGVDNALRIETSSFILPTNITAPTNVEFFSLNLFSTLFYNIILCFSSTTISKSKNNDLSRFPALYMGSGLNYSFLAVMPSLCSGSAYPLALQPVHSALENGILCP